MQKGNRIRITIVTVSAAAVILFGLNWWYRSRIGSHLEARLAASIKLLPTRERVVSERTAMSALREVGEAMRRASKRKSSDDPNIVFFNREFWATEVKPLFAVFDTPMVTEYPIANPSESWPSSRALSPDTKTAHLLLRIYALEMADEGKARAAMGAIANGLRVARDCADHFGENIAEYGCEACERWVSLFLSSEYLESDGLKLAGFPDEEVRLLCRELEEVDTLRADIRHTVIWKGAALATYCVAGFGVRELGEDAWLPWESDRSIATRVLVAGAELARRLPRELTENTGEAWRRYHLSEIADRYGRKTVAYLFASACRVQRSRSEVTLGLRVLRLVCQERLGKQTEILDPWGQAIKRRVLGDRVEYWSDGPPGTDDRIVLRYWVEL